MSPLVLCSLTIIVTLLVSGIAKAKDPASTASAIVNLKIDSWVPMKFSAKVLPWAELALALWLLVMPGWLGILGGVAAVLLFAFYWLIIGRALLTGNTASCNCFGSASQAPVSEFTLGRNTALFGAAMGTLIGAAQTGKSAAGMLFALDSTGWLWLLGAAFIAAALWCVYRGDLLAEPSASSSSATEATSIANLEVAEDHEEGDYIRLPIPYGTVYRLSNQMTVSLRELANQQARVLFWVSPTCGHCHEVIAKINDWQEQLPMLKINPVLASTTAHEDLGFADDIEILVDEMHHTSVAFGRGTPMAVALGADGLLAGGPVSGSTDVLQFMEDLIYEFTLASEEAE